MMPGTVDSLYVCNFDRFSCSILKELKLVWVDFWQSAKVLQQIRRIIGG